jgi:hypothetical protein
LGIFNLFVMNIFQRDEFAFVTEKIRAHFTEKIRAQLQQPPQPHISAIIVVVVVASDETETLPTRATMRFSALAILAVLAPAASGFVVPSHRLNVGVASRTSNGGPMFMALEDLEKKLLNPDADTKKSKPEPKPKPAPKPKPEPKKPEPKKSKKEIEAEAKAKAEELKRIAEFEKAAAEKKAQEKVRSAAKAVKTEAKKVKYDLDTPLNKPPPVRVKKEMPKVPSFSAPSFSIPSLPKPAPKPKGVVKPASTAAADANAGPLGVALGAAPLVAVPFVGLAVARGALSKTAARRAQIQKEIAAAEEARKKKSIKAEVDAGTLAKATVRDRNGCFI